MAGRLVRLALRPSAIGAGTRSGRPGNDEYTVPWHAPSSVDANELRSGDRMREDWFPVLWRKRV